MDLEGLPCLVVGGGKVAERKVVTLLSCGAKVTLVSPDVTPLLNRLRQKRRIACFIRKYKTSDVRGMRIVIGATGDAIANERIFKDAEVRGIPVNIVDQPHLCRFIVPAVIAHRDISIAICTGGAAPGITAIMRQELEQGLFKKYPGLVAALKGLRPRLKMLSPGQKEAFWKKLKAPASLKTVFAKANPRPVIEKWLLEIKGRNI